MESIPHSTNFCGGNFQDWLEVNLTKNCQAKCAWCIDRNAYHPPTSAHWETIVKMALITGKQNIILLGGEPTLHPDLEKICSALHVNGRRVWITTNGALLTPEFVRNKLQHVYGVNISVHHYIMSENAKITHLKLNGTVLKESIAQMHRFGINVRMNCNLIKGFVDSYSGVIDYVRWAMEIGADRVRFAELKIDEENFVDARNCFPDHFNLPEDPYKDGCNKDGMCLEFPLMYV